MTSRAPADLLLPTCLSHEAKAWQAVTQAGARLVLGPVLGGTSCHVTMQVADLDAAWPIGTVVRLFGGSGQQRVLLAEQWMAERPGTPGGPFGPSWEACRYQGAPFSTFEAEVLVPRSEGRIIGGPTLTPQASWWIRSSAIGEAPGPHNPAGYTRADTGIFSVPGGVLPAPTMIIDANPKRRRLFLTPDAATLAAAIADPAGFLTLLIGFDQDAPNYPIFATAFGPGVRVEFRNTRPVFASFPDGVPEGAPWSGAWLQECD